MMRWFKQKPGIMNTNVEYFQFSKLLFLIGLWPTDHQFRSRMKFYLFMLGAASVVIPQSLALFTAENDLILVLENIIAITADIVTILLYSIWYLNSSKVYLLKLQAEEDLKMFLENEEDRKIIQHHYGIARIISILGIVTSFMATIPLWVIPLVLSISDTVAPRKDGSKRRGWPFQTDYIIFNREDYFNILAIQSGLVWLSFSCLHAGMPSFMAVSIEHSCALLSLVWFFDLLEEITTYLVLIIDSWNHITITILGFYLVFYHPPFIIVLQLSALAIAMVVYLTTLNWAGQRIRDKKDEVLHSVFFKTRWYLLPPKLRRIVLLMMVGSTNCSGLTVRKLAEVSLKTAGILLKSASSNIMILKSLEESGVFQEKN